MSDVRTAPAEGVDGEQRFTAYDIEVEQALLGGFLASNRTIAEAQALVRPDEFYDPLHQALCELIFEYDGEGRPANPLTIHAWSKHWPGLKAVGGQGYLANLAAAAPAVPNVKDLCSIIRDHAMRRRAFGAIEEAADALGTPGSAFAALEPVVSAADEIAERSGARQGEEAHEAGYQLLRRNEQESKESERRFSCPTGLKRLNKMIGGLIPRNLIVVAGRPGMGKTTLGTALARAAAEAGWSPDYWSIEMPGEHIAARLQTEIDYERAIREGLKPLHYSRLIQLRADEDEVARAGEANLRLADLGITVFDNDTVTAAEIAAVTRARVRRSQKRKLVIIDHLGLVEPDERYRGRKVDELSEMTKAFKKLAKRLDIPVVLLCQLSRGVEARDDKRPYLSDLRDSGSIEQDADVVIMLYRAFYYAEEASRKGKTEEARVKASMEADRVRNLLEVLVRKNRNGATGEMECFVDVAASAVRGEKPTPGEDPQLYYQLMGGQ